MHTPHIFFIVILVHSKYRKKLINVNNSPLADATCFDHQNRPIAWWPKKLRKIPKVTMYMARGLEHIS